MPSQNVEHHIATVRELSKPGGALAPDAPSATINNPSWWSDGQPTPSRDRLHRRLLAEAHEAAAGVEQGRRALVLAGPPGAGKGVARSAALGDEQGKYLVIDADDFKKALLRQAMADRSYESWIKPDEVRVLEDAGEKFYPLELAALVHEESSHLAKELRADAIKSGDNLVVDTVLSSEEGALSLGRQLETAGYAVQVVDVEVPYEVSEDRVRERWFGARAAAERATDEAEELGGRWVPSEYARQVFDSGDAGRSKPEVAARRLATECGAVSEYRVYRTSAEDEERAKAQGKSAAHPVLEVHMRRASPEARLDSPDIAEG